MGSPYRSRTARSAVMTATTLSPPATSLPLEELRGGVVGHRGGGLLAGGAQGQPRMHAAVEMEQFAKAGPGLPAAPMPAPRPALGHQPPPPPQRPPQCVRPGG